MLDKATILKTIDDAYATRARGDKDGLAKFLAPGATYRMAAQVLPPGFPEGSGDAKQSVDALIDLVKFESFERVDAIVEGNTAAVHWRVTFSTAKGGRAESELYDLWKFNPDGKAQSLLQFGDTALLNRLLGGR